MEDSQQQEFATGIIIPVMADSIEKPEVYYNSNYTGIYFKTDDYLDYGRITFENLDSLRICRGEYPPYPDNWDSKSPLPWVYIVNNSKWLKERFNYEKDHYEDSYEFNGNVHNMLTDFKHYLFKFHDEYIETIARGFWWETDKNSLFKKKLQEGHPFLNLPNTKTERFIAHNITCDIRYNEKPIEELIANAKFCSQKLYEFDLELDGKTSLSYSVTLSYRNDRLISKLLYGYGKEKQFEGVAKIKDIKPYIEKDMEKIAKRRKEMGK